jgi:hypothetical protein
MDPQRVQIGRLNAHSGTRFSCLIIFVSGALFRRTAHPCLIEHDAEKPAKSGTLFSYVSDVTGLSNSRARSLKSHEIHWGQREISSFAAVQKHF